MKMNFWEELKKRGLISQFTPGIEKFFNKKGTLYLGIDPTSDGLHLGHFLGFSLLRRFFLNGFKIILLIGGGTAKIGDPSGKIKERPILPLEVLEKNKRALKKEIKKFFPLNSSKVRLVDNSLWLDNLKLMDFLRDIGKLVSINSMLDLEVVRKRIENQEFMSLAEFTYQILQAYDYFILYKKYGCELQIGGSDQWGNIIQGVELIRKKLNAEVYALVYPLLIDPKTGRKFGKTEAGETLWLNPKKTHPFKIYQFLINLDDELSKEYIYYFSFKSLEEIEKLINEALKNKEARLIQNELAREIITLIHGSKVYDEVLEIKHLLFERDFESLTLKDLKKIKPAINNILASRNESLEDLMVKLSLSSSKSEARNLVKNGSIKVKDFGKFVLIKKGKKDFGLVEFK